MPMNPEIKAKWCAALRSGEYEQGRGGLRVDDSFCCLGVLCDIHSKETGTRWNGAEYLAEDLFLPNTVAKWAGLPNRPHAVNASLHNYNDGALGLRAKSFPEIADLIEKHL